MKKLLWINLFILLFFFTPYIVKAQFGGKPLYDIMVTELGDTLGTIRVELYPTIAPLHVANFDSIVNAPINFDNRAFHRIVPGFVIQGGDPNSISGPESTWGQGDPNQANVNAEFNPISHQRGILSAARAADPNSASSQFFICVAAATSLDGNYSVYGNTISGIDIVDTIVLRPRDLSNDRPNDKIEMFINYVGVDSTAPVYGPTLISPGDVALDVFGSTQFSWLKADSNDFLTYKIQFSQQSDFSTIDLEQDMDTSLSADFIEGLDQGFKTYHWRVCSNNGGKLTCSASRSLTTFIGTPELLFPTVALYPATVIPNFSWSSVDGADAYHIQVSKNENFNIVIQHEIDTTVSDTSFQIHELETSTKYYWRVAAEVGGVVGDYGDFRAFITTPNAGIEELSIQNPITVFPNPSNGRFSFKMDKQMPSGAYQLEIMDLKGTLVHSENVLLSAGDQLNLNLNLPSGLFVYKIYNSDNNFRGQLILQSEVK